MIRIIAALLFAILLTPAQAQQVKQLALGIQTWDGTQKDYPIRLGAGGNVTLVRMVIGASVAKLSSGNAATTVQRTVLFSIYNPTMQWASAANGIVLRPPAANENFGVANTLFSRNLKQVGSWAVHTSEVVELSNLVIPGGEVRVAVVPLVLINGSVSTAAAEAPDFELQTEFVFTQ